MNNTEKNILKDVEIYTSYECEHCEEMYKEPKKRGLCPCCEIIFKQGYQLAQKENQEQILKIIDECEIGIRNDLANPKIKRDEGGIIGAVCRIIKIKLLLGNKAQKENQSQISTGNDGSNTAKGIYNADVSAPSCKPETLSDTQLQKYKKETAEKVEKLKKLFNNTTPDNRESLYYCLEIIDKIFKETK